MSEVIRGLREECGVFGAYDTAGGDTAPLVYYGLFALQHRGQESCGIAVSDRGVVSYHKAMGLVGDVFERDRLTGLTGDIAIGHVRYSTTGQSVPQNAQPIVTSYVKGWLAIAHNGNLTNYAPLKRELMAQGMLFHTSVDSELISYLIAQERTHTHSIEEALSGVMRRIEGAYSLVIMSPRKLLAMRDPFGFRPLCIGRRGTCYVVASETCALDSIGAEFVRDVLPGEIILIDKGGVHSCAHNPAPRSAHCIFEYIYFARPDSVVDGVSVTAARERAGELLAQTHPVDADIVCGVPDSGLDAALGYARASGIPYSTAFVKSRYIGRTFIAPSQDMRELAVRLKLNANKSHVSGRSVVLIDDSIVRGTTCANIVRLLRQAGAREVHMRISSPPFLHPCYYGTDVPESGQLIAHGRTTEEVARIIGVDSLGYLPVDQLSELTGRDGYCDACFTGNYPLPEPKESEPDWYMRPV